MKKWTTIVLMMMCLFTGFSFITDEWKWEKPKAFPPPVYNFKNNEPTKAGFELGRKLFYDPILSADNSTSCGTCHQQFAAFAHIDHALSHGIGGRIGTRNVPSLQNLIWNKSFMWDGGVNHLEVQPLAPITNENEMGSKLPDVISRIKSDENYKKYFLAAFSDSIITTAGIMKAMAQFTGMMISANSRYDAYIAGKEKFTEAEKNGLKIFTAKCGSCHPAPLFTDNDFHNNGIAFDSALNDYGRKHITQLEADNHKFKVPSLRNVAVTFPYMHDGRFNRLKEVMDHYSNLNNLSADAALLKTASMNDKEKKDIIAFLLTLTDVQFLNDKRFSDPNQP